MPRPEKVQAVENIREQVDEARATFVTEYRGLTVAEQQKLRRDIRQAQGEYRVLKMSLARRAVEDMEVEGLSELLAGPTALAFASSDPVPVAKALKEFASEHENLVIKGALLAGALLPPEQISRLAEIESRDVLLGKIAGGFKSPMSKLAGMLGAKMRDAASMFSQLLEKKETEAPAAAETEAAAEAEVEEAPAVEAVEETPEAEVEETAEAEVEEAPAVEAVEETPEAEVEETAEAEVEEAPAVEAVEETPEAEVEETAETEAEEAPAEEPEEKPKKKAAPKAKAEESAAPADADATEEAESDADETAEEE